MVALPIEVLGVGWRSMLVLSAFVLPAVAGIGGLIGSWRPWAYPAWTFGVYRPGHCLPLLLLVPSTNFLSWCSVFLVAHPSSDVQPRSSSGGLMCNHRSPQIIGMCRSPWTALPSLGEMQRVLDVSSRSKGFSSPSRRT